MMPEWKKIEYKPNYSISNEGLVRNDKTGRVFVKGNMKGWMFEKVDDIV